MARKPRLDHPGAVHHVTVRGIDRCTLFADDRDRWSFIDSLRHVICDSETRCLAWALMTNHVHVLLETGGQPVSKVLQRLLTRYAMHFNRRHDRVGHLFQNRFHSRRVSSDRHLLSSIRYIHLNPVEAGLVDGISALDSYPWTGHATLMGRRRAGFQDVRRVLALFDKPPDAARAELRAFTAAGIGQPEEAAATDAGPLPLSFRAQFEAREFGIRAIQARSRAIDSAVRRLDSREACRAAAVRRGWTLDVVVRHICRRMHVLDEDLVEGRRTADVAAARAAAAWIAWERLGRTQTEIARRVGVTQPAIAACLARGRATGRRFSRDLERTPREAGAGEGRPSS
jgi:REP element-mobilizing transposase RayT